jgi:glyoxylase-like metal-dependent hydrolase (beta-lactamase superfamily II)
MPTQFTLQPFCDWIRHELEAELERRWIVDTVARLPEAYTEFQEPVTIDQELRPGDSIDVGRELEVISTPGHAPGSICYVADTADTAFTGDHVLLDISPNPLLTLQPDSEDERTRSLPQYLNSLDTLRATDIGAALTGHGELVADLPRRIDEIQNHHAARKDRIAEMVAEMRNPTAYRIMCEMFSNLPATEAFPGMSEVIGHLDLLEDEGRISITEAEEVLQYTRNSS